MSADGLLDSIPGAFLGCKSMRKHVAVYFEIFGASQQHDAQHRAMGKTLGIIYIICLHCHINQTATLYISKRGRQH